MCNLIKHIALDDLLAEWQDMVLKPSIEASFVGKRVLDLLAAMIAGSKQRDVVSRTDDEFGALCWQELSKHLAVIPKEIRIIAEVGAGPFASPTAMSFVQDITRAIRLGGHDGRVEMPSPDDEGLSRFHVKTLRAELAPWPGRRDDDLVSGEVHLHAEQLESGDWSTAIVYSRSDLASSAVMANHYWLMPPNELYHAVLMHDSNGDNWAYITRPWELPDGGNVMRVRASNAEQMLRLGMHSYPMKNDNAYHGFVLWDKSEFLQGNPPVSRPIEWDLEDGSFEHFAEMLLLAQFSGWIENIDDWERYVGTIVREQDVLVPVPNLDITYADVDLVVNALADGASLSEAGTLAGLSGMEMVRWFNSARVRDCVSIFKSLTIEAEYGRRLARTNGKRMSNIMRKRTTETLSEGEERELLLMQEGQGLMGKPRDWEAALELSRAMRQEIQLSSPSAINAWYRGNGMK